MNKKKYLNKVLHGIKCSIKMKKEIRKQLESDIDGRIEAGETLENVLIQMGTVKEVAESFNENMSSTEKKVHTRNIIFKILGLLAVVLAIAVITISSFMPKTFDISENDIFNEEQVKEKVIEYIVLFNEEDFEELQNTSIEAMQSTFTSEGISDIKSQFAEDWGNQTMLGNIYMFGLIQSDQYYVVTEIIVAYENVTVTYRITLDEDMNLAGLYIR